MRIIDCPSGRVTEPGFYRMRADHYHADPCPEPSLSSSVAKVILRETPKHAHAKHPRYTPQGERTPTAPMLFGSAVHKLVLGEGAKIAVIDFDDFKSGDARKERDKALAFGKIPLLTKDFDRADIVAERVRQRIKLVAGAGDMFEGEKELVAIWREGETWCRAMFDSIRVGDARARIDDLKTSGVDFGPYAVGKLISNMGYEVSQAFYVRGVCALLPRFSVDFRFAFVETDPPYEASVVKLDGAAFEHGRRQVCAALAIWQRCQASGIWPGYPLEIVRAELPGYAIASWEARETDDPMLEGVSY